jgi:hypothetical protein
MLYNVTFNNISVILWRSVLLVEETGEKPPTCRKLLSHMYKNNLLELYILYLE